MSKRKFTDKSQLIEKAKKRYIETRITKPAYVLRLLGTSKKSRYDVVIPFVCQKCGTCCKVVGTQWTRPDVYLAAEYLEMELEDFAETYLGEKVNESESYTHT